MMTKDPSMRRSRDKKACKMRIQMLSSSIKLADSSLSPTFQFFITCDLATFWRLTVANGRYRMILSTSS